MEHDGQLQVLYLLALLVLPVIALINRFTRGVGKPQRFTAHDGERTYEGEYWVENGIVYVRCPAGQRGRLTADQRPVRTAEALLIDIYRDQGLAEL